MIASIAKIDTRLEPLFLGASDEQADEHLLRLITLHAEPVIKGIIRYKLHLNAHRADGRAEADDIYQEALVQLLAEFEQFRRQPDEHPITDIRGMAAVIAHRTCSRWMRRQFPERHALKNRLQYLLTRQRGFALWQDEDRKQVAGFAVWQGQKKAASAARLAGLSDDEGLLAHIHMLKSGRPQELGDALAAIFNHLGSPVEFDELVSAWRRCSESGISRLNRWLRPKTPARFRPLPGNPTRPGRSKNGSFCKGCGKNCNSFR